MANRIQIYVGQVKGMKEAIAKMSETEWEMLKANASAKH